MHKLRNKLKHKVIKNMKNKEKKNTEPSSHRQKRQYSGGKPVGNVSTIISILLMLSIIRYLIYIVLESYPNKKFNSKRTIFLILSYDLSCSVMLKIN